MDDGQSEKSGTVINRLRGGSQFSKFTDTDMIRVVEEEEENYLRNLEDDDSKKATRPYSTT